MAIKTKPTTDLFRFATLRAPQLISETDKKIGFIQHPNLAKSYFVKDIINESDIDVSRGHVITKANSFPNGNKLKSIREVENVNRDVWKFSITLMKNKNQLKEKTDYKLPSVLSDSELYKLWDNVFYSLVTREKLQVRQACLQMIVTNNYINTVKSSESYIDNIRKNIQYPKRKGDFTDEEKKAQFLRRLANSNVIVPAAFTIKKDYKNTSETRGKSVSKSRRINKLKNTLISNVKDMKLNLQKLI